MRLRTHLALWAGIFGIYFLILLLGLGILQVPKYFRPAKQPVWQAWQMPDTNSIPAGTAGDRIRYGMQIFNSTPWTAREFAGGTLSCGDCHIAGGVSPRALPLVNAPSWFPMYSRRAGHVISLQQRIQECFVRSENGRPPANQSSVMLALLAYFNWLAEPQPLRRPFRRRGLAVIPRRRGDPVRGAAIYARHCAGCHGADGGGNLPTLPPLWGANSFNDGAGMSRPEKMAPFVYATMPQNRPGILSVQDAWDVSAYVAAQPRPAFNPAYKKY